MTRLSIYDELKEEERLRTHKRGKEDNKVIP